VYNLACRAVLDSAMYSASVVELEIHCCFLKYQAIVYFPS